MRRVRWLGIRQTAGATCAAMAVRLRQHEYSATSNSGFRLRYVGASRIEAEHVVKNVLEHEVYDPTGAVFLAREVSFHTVRFTILPEHSLLELYECPRSLKPFQRGIESALCDLVSVRPISVDPLEWSQPFQGKDGSFMVTSARYSSLSLTAKTRITLVLTGSEDVQQYISAVEPKAKADRIRFVREHDGQRSDIELTASAAAYFRMARVEDSIVKLRERLHQLQDDVLLPET